MTLLYSSYLPAGGRRGNSRPRTALLLALSLVLSGARGLNAQGNDKPSATKAAPASKLDNAAGTTSSEENNKTAPPGATKSNDNPGPTQVRMEATDSDDANLRVIPCALDAAKSRMDCTDQAISVKVTDAALRAKLKQFQAGDSLRVNIQAGELKDLLGPVSLPDQGTNPAYILLTLVACALLILGIAALATKGHPLKFIVGMDNRYSNSKFQLALWFWVLISTYMTTVFLRICYAGWDFIGGVNIPQNLLMLSGLSVLTYGGAKAITTAKVNAAMSPVPPVAGAAAPIANPDPKNALAPGQETFFRDLVQNDFGGFDFGDFQMAVVTLIAVVMYLLLVFHFLQAITLVKSVTLPDVDTTILAGFGLGQGAYLTKKAAGNVGSS